MSLILEALKKSEAERRLGRVPGLMTPASGPSGGTGRAWLPGFLLGLSVALLLVAAAAGAWWWSTRSDPAPLAPSVETPDAVTDAPLSQQEPVPQPLSQTAEESAASRSTPHREPPAATVPAEVIAQVPTRTDPEFAGVERESAPMPAGSIPLSSAPVAPPPQRATSPDPVQAPPAPRPPAVASGMERGGASTAEPPAEPLEPVPLLSMLLPAQREGLPPLRLSMHVYDADPAGRFVLIDGRRYRQGDAIQTGLVVDTIRPDGALIAHGSLRFLVPRP